MDVYLNGLCPVKIPVFILVLAGDCFPNFFSYASDLFFRILFIYFFKEAITLIFLSESLQLFPRNALQVSTAMLTCGFFSLGYHANILHTVRHVVEQKQVSK